MRDKKDFFSEETPAHHDQNVRQAVADGLRKNRASKGPLGWWNQSFTLRGLAVASVAAVVSYLVANRHQQNDTETFIAQESLLLGTDVVSGQDIESLADSDFDFELLENLDLLEELEDV